MPNKILRYNLFTNQSGAIPIDAYKTHDIELYEKSSPDADPIFIGVICDVTYSGKNNLEARLYYRTATTVKSIPLTRDTPSNDYLLPGKNFYIDRTFEEENTREREKFSKENPVAISLEKKD